MITPKENFRIDIDGKKYTYISYDNGLSEVLRYGALWISTERMTNLPGNNMWSSMAWELHERRKADNERDEFVRRLDVAINGEEGAAKQARLIDLVSQLEGGLKPLRQVNGHKV